MKCKEIDAELDAYLDGELEAEPRRRFAAHVAECEVCRGRLEAAERLQRTLAALPAPGPSPGFYERALATAARPARSRTWIGWTAGIAAALALAAIVPQLERSVTQSASQRATSGGATTGVPAVTMALHETRKLNLVFASASALESVSLAIDLPPGVELAGYPGRREVRWTTALNAGKNVLPLELVASKGQGGQLVATLHHDGTEKTFRVSIAVMPG